MLYEPTNIIPSTMTQTGTVAATTDNVNIQWQVNGNSAMTMFQIDVMQNNAESTLVYSTGVVAENPTIAQGYGLPFYGKDRFGDYVQFMYQPNQTWATWSGNTILDGNSYKFRITQFFQENGIAYKVPITSNLSVGTTYYFAEYISGVTQYVSFTVANASYFVSGNTIYFNFSHRAGWVATSGNNSRAITDITFSVSGTQPSGTLLSGAVAVSSGDTFYNQFFTSQKSASSFITRTEPTLTITPLEETPVASAVQNFTATYSQAQGDSINTVRWQLYNADDMSAPIDDTGGISTSVLSYEYSGLFDGQSYSVVCMVTTESGVAVSSMLDFSVQYEQGAYTGKFTAQPLCQEDANLLQWNEIETFPGVDNPTNSANYSDGKLELPDYATLTWSQRTESDDASQTLNFEAPWTAVWNGDVDSVVSQFLKDVKKVNLEIGEANRLAKNNVEFSGYVHAVTFSPDGSLLLVCGSFTGCASLFSVSDTTITYLSDITKSGTSLTGGAFTASFSPDGSLLVLGGGFSGYASLFSVSATTVTYLSDIFPIGGMVFDVAFNPAGSLLVVCGDFAGYGKLYSVGNTSVTYLSDITNSNIQVRSASAASFSPNGSLLIIGGGFSGYAACFSVSGTTVTYLSDITKNGTPLTGTGGVQTVAFNSDGALLVLGGNFSGFASLFSVSSTTVTYVSDIAKGNTPLTGTVSVASFSPDGSLLVLGGGFSGYASLFSVSGTIVTYLSDISNNDESGTLYAGSFSPDGTKIVLAGAVSFWVTITNDEESLPGTVNVITFNPDGSLLLVAGFDSGKSKPFASLFSVNGTTVTYLSDITNEGMPLEGAGVGAAAFSPDGSLLVLCGYFEGASLLSVSGTTVTYLSKITKNDGGSVGDYVTKAAFSPDGSLLVLCSLLSGYAFLFSVGSTEVIYLSDVTKNGTPLTGSPNEASFNHDGSLLVLGGGFSGYASLFSVNGTTVTYLSDITKNGAPLTGAVTVAAFSPNGSLLIISGNFSGYVSCFSVSGTTVTYLSDITKNGAPLTINAMASAFSPDGSLLVLGGMFSGWASMFSVSGTAVTYLSDITKGGGSLTAYVNAVTFSPDGSLLVLGGRFSGYASIWRVLGSNDSIGNVFSILPNNVSVSKNGQVILLKNSNNSTLLAQTYILGAQQGAANNIVVVLTSTELQVYAFRNGQYIGKNSTTINNFVQQNVGSVQLGGKQTCNYFAIIDGNGENVEQYFSNSTFVPEWNNNGIYTVDLLADFNYGLDGGTATEQGAGFRIYRRVADGTESVELASLPPTTSSLRDYGIKSNKSYVYDFYVYGDNNTFMGVRSTEETPLKRQFKRFSLLSTQYNESDKCYHVAKEYQFSCNIQDMTVSNNSNKTYVQNFTPYPTVFQSTVNYASGTLQALIGFVDPNAYKYWDSTQLMDELNALSTTTNTLFLKDMKGHLWMVDVGTVQMTATQKTREMQVTISLPWTEIGDASDVSIIQTPDDEGWNTDAQVLDVKLDVDVETGLLYAVYPFPYNGTAFYLVGVTPEGVVSAVQPLPSTASQPTDGQLKAVVRHK